ncbi:hypothetical protein PRJ39_05955 [Lysobacter enzymogenes]|uniref:hypothetical protein n=1 Tax=Lysobacter enzymogenes TaxID=69 RepID=UPI0037489464
MSRSTERAAITQDQGGVMRKRPFQSLLVAAALSAAPLFAHAADAPGLRITYLVYSGRPNPELTVTDPAQLRAIESRLGDALAAPARAGAAAEPALGYNGILIEPIGGSSAKARPQAVTVKGRNLSVDTAAATEFKSATAATRVSAAAGDLESMLLKLGQKRGVLDATTLNVLLDGK